MSEMFFTRERHAKAFLADPSLQVMAEQYRSRPDILEDYLEVESQPGGAIYEAHVEGSMGAYFAILVDAMAALDWGQIARDMIRLQAIKEEV